MRYELNGHWYTINELAEKSGVIPHTLRDRLRRGYSVEEAVKVLPVHDSVREFTNNSWYEDWIGISTNALYTIFWNWCIEHGYNTVSKQCFSRQIFSMYPQLKTVPTKVGCNSYRMIRRR